MAMKSLDPNRIASIILALALALALAGCSAIKLGYSNLPNLAYWWLDNYADFSDEQAVQVRDEIARVHAWHRQNELPKLMDLLTRVEQVAPGEVSPQQACSLLAEGRLRLKAVADHAEAPIVAVAATLTDREHRHIQRKFRRKNDEFRKDWVAVSRADRLEKREKQMTERLEMFYGRLDDAQRLVLRQRLEQSAFDPARSLGEWERRQQDLLQILRRVSQRGLGEAEARAQIRGWIDRIDKAPDAGYRAYQETLLQEGCATFAAVHQSTTPAQREQAVRRLRAYQRDIRDLMASS
jgi:Family of unknown function (DUF6279)